MSKVISMAESVLKLSRAGVLLSRGSALLCVLGLCALTSAQQATLPELSLDEAVAQALANNAKLRTARDETKRSVEELAAQKTKRYPNLSAYALGSQLLTKPQITYQKGAFGTYSGTGPIPGQDTTITIPRKPSGIVIASAAEPLTTQYQLHLQLKGLSAGVAVARQDEAKQALETVDEVRRAYYAVVQAQSSLESTQASLPLYRESKRLAAQNYKQEAVFESDVLGADAQLLQTENSVSESMDDLAVNQEKLNDLMGRDIHSPFRVTNAANIDVTQESIETLEERALDRSPALKRAQFKVQQAEFEQRAKKAEYIPDISASFNYSTTINFGSTLPSNITSVGLLLNWEPWDWGRKLHELAGKRQLADEARISAGSTQRSVLMDVRSAARQVEDSRRKVMLGQANQRAARQKLKEVQEQVQQEQKLTKDLYSAQTDLATADSKSQQALAAFWKAQADLKKATGDQ